MALYASSLLTQRTTVCGQYQVPVSLTDTTNSTSTWLPGSKVYPANGTEDVEDRVIAGNWEDDLITGSYNATAIGTLVERTSGYIQLVHLPTDHTAGSVCAAVAATMTLLPPEMRRSLTWDQGAEMAEHATVTRVLDHGVFFAHAASPWQRGSNENANGLLRQYFAKSTDLSIQGVLDLRAAEDRFNNRPRKRHG